MLFSLIPVQKLRLSDENRELIHKGQLKRRGGTQSETADLDVYLLDNMILLTRTKYSNKMEKTGIYRKVCLERLPDF